MIRLERIRGRICCWLGKLLYPRDPIIQGLTRSNAALRRKIESQTRTMQRIIRLLPNDAPRRGFDPIVPEKVDRPQGPMYLSLPQTGQDGMKPKEGGTDGKPL